MNKIKLFIDSDRGRNIATIIIVILVGLGSFGLGRLSKDSSLAGIKIEYPSQPLNSLSGAETTESVPDLAQNSSNQLTKTSQTAKGSTNSVGKAYFASKLGHKYYSIGCSGGKTLKPENKIYFATEAEAISAGYEKSSTCK